MQTNSEEMSVAERRRARMRQEMRSEILAGARRLLQARGLDALTMRAVADEIGYSTGAIYEYFKSKDDLCGALFFQGTEGLDGMMARAIADLPVDSTVHERLGVAGSAYRQFALEHPDLYRLIFTSQVPDPPPTIDMMEQEGSFQSMIELVAEGIQRGELRPAEPLQLATALWAFVHGFVMLELTGHLPDEPAGIRDEMFQVALEMMGSGLIPALDENHHDQSEPTTPPVVKRELH